MTSVTDIYGFKDESTSEISRDVFFLFERYLEKPSMSYCIQKSKMSSSINDSFAGGSQRMSTKVNLIDKLHTDLAN